MMTRKQIEISIHAVLILTILVMINIPGFNLRIGLFSTGDLTFLWPSVIGTFINCILFYGNSYLLIPSYLRLRKRITYILLLIASFSLLTAIEIIIDYGLAKRAGIDVEANGGWSEIIVLVVLINLLTLLASFAYRFSKDWFYHEHLQRQLKEEKLAAQLAFLKAQVNPHFLFNTLNNLFAMAMKSKDEATAEGIRKLAGLMRYMLHESNSERIELSKELEYINNYVELQRIRLINQQGTTVHIDVTGNPDSIRVAPMLFIPFIENAFKHGISLSSPSPISIQFTIRENEIKFCVRNIVNTLRRPEPEGVSGVGLENVKKRLNLLYPSKHTLTIETKLNEFIVNLTLQQTNR